MQHIDSQLNICRNYCVAELKPEHVQHKAVTPDVCLTSSGDCSRFTKINARLKFTLHFERLSILIYLVN
jgi:hypothetical protein